MNGLGIGGQVVITVTGPVTWTGGLMLGALTPDIAIGNVFTYNISDFSAINIRTAFGLQFITNTTAQTGDPVCINVSVTPGADNNPANNTFQYCSLVRNSLDPNEKEVTPDSVAPGYQDWLIYSIQFQNTGTAPAINIRVEDLLDNQLDLSTFEIINYSHANIPSFSGDTVNFNFRSIYLDDSTSNAAGSIGFVQYRIKPLPGLPVGHIDNFASIYFDYNPAVITDTAIVVSDILSGVNSPVVNSQISIYPNPTTGQFTITFANEIKNTTVQIINPIGEVVFDARIPNASSESKSRIKLDVAKGIYFVKITDDKKIYIKRLIVE